MSENQREVLIQSIAALEIWLGEIDQELRDLTSRRDEMAAQIYSAKQKLGIKDN